MTRARRVCYRYGRNRCVCVCVPDKYPRRIVTSEFEISCKTKLYARERDENNIAEITGIVLAY